MPFQMERRCKNVIHRKGNCRNPKDKCRLCPQTKESRTAAIYQIRIIQGAERSTGTVSEGERRQRPD